jgi:hypothetical protein
MNEAEWATWADPDTMLDCIRGPKIHPQYPFPNDYALKHPVIATDRMLILWASGCCRRLGHLFHDARCLDAVLTAERFADGELTYKELRSIGEEIGKWARNTQAQDGGVSVRSFVAQACLHLVEGGDTAYDSGCTPYLVPAHDATRWAVAAIRENAGDVVAEREKIAQCSILRDILGNPFRPPPAIDPSWTTWNDGTVVELAQAVYQEKVFDRLPILADALEAAGCTNEEILAHCRGPGPHVRGCWVVDLILGKQ